MYKHRVIEDQALYLSEHFPVVVVTGARQTGKTTMIRHLHEGEDEVNYITLDYPPIRELAKNDPELFLQRYQPPVIIDEIQYAPELFPYIKIRVDEDRTPGQYFLTGSQMFRLMKDVSETLAGRVGLLSMYPFSKAEVLGRDEFPFVPGKKRDHFDDDTVVTIFDRIYRGWMPQMVIDEDLTPESFYGEYVNTYLERDVRDLIEARNESRFFKFLSGVAARVSQEVNLSEIGRDVGIDSKTADSWLSILVSSGVVHLLQPYSSNVYKRIVKRPKLYFMDTGLACYLSLWNNPRTLEASAMAGAFFENYVVSEIVKQYSNQGLDTRSRLCFYRDSNGREIDLMIIENGIIYPIEIKKTANPGEKAVKSFGVLGKSGLTVGRGAVICLAGESYPIDANNDVVSVREL